MEKIEQPKQPSLRKEEEIIAEKFIREGGQEVAQERKYVHYYDGNNRLVKSEKWLEGELYEIEKNEYDEKNRIVHKIFEDKKGKSKGKDVFFRYSETPASNTFYKETLVEDPEGNEDLEPIRKEWYDQKGRLITDMDWPGDGRKDYEYEGDEKEYSRMHVTTRDGYTRTYERED